MSPIAAFTVGVTADLGEAGCGAASSAVDVKVSKSLRYSRARLIYGAMDTTRFCVCPPGCCGRFNSQE